MAIECAGKLVFISVDVDKFEEYSRDHGIEAMPTTLILKNGQ